MLTYAGDRLDNKHVVFGKVIDGLLVGTPTYVSSYYYICVLVLLHTSIYVVFGKVIDGLLVGTTVEV
jgi:cyclophilin family peptidyl-prolyl cis-trans isomerase